MGVHAKRLTASRTQLAALPNTPVPNDFGETLFGHPKGLYILFLTEMWERFSYYGMRALLMLYMVQHLHYDTHRAGTVYGLYTGLVYLTPIVGGLLADRYLGQRRAIVIGGVLMALGQFAMAFEAAPFFYAALGLLIVGNGFFKPNISVIVGQLYAPDDPRRDGAFTIFYMGINLGAFFSPLICGTLGQLVGWHWGFAAAGVGMVIGMIVYHLGQPYLGEHGLHPVSFEPATSEATPEFSNKATRAPLSKVDMQRIGAIVVLALFGNIIFWSAFEQAGSSLALFAEQSTNLVVPLTKWHMPSSWFQSANPFFIILLGPAFTVLWLALARAKLEPSTPAKFVIGTILLALGFVGMMTAGQLFDSSGPVSMLWLTGAYFCFTCGELCVSPVGLSVVTKLAPPRYQSLMMGLWFASMAVANMVAGEFAGEYGTMSKATFFSVPVFTAGAAAIALLLLVRPLQRLMHGVR